MHEHDRIPSSALLSRTVSLVGVGTFLLLTGCDDNVSGSGGSGTATTTAATGSTTTATASSASGGGCTAACCPKAECVTADPDCIALTDNAGQTKFGLRVAQLDLTKPVALSSGIVAATIASNILLDDATCNLTGSGSFSWLLQFDTAAGTLKTGGAKPVNDPKAGYAFDDEMVTQGGHSFHVQPVTFTGVTPDAGGKFAVMSGADLVLPIFLDATGTQVVLLPITGARFSMGALSANQNCIGHYNAAGLDPDAICIGDASHPTFLAGGAVEGLVILEEADSVIVAALQQSLCTLLTGDASTYGTKGGDGITRCKRDANGVIIYQGDTCSMAGQSCKDAVTVDGAFAASAVKITN